MDKLGPCDTDLFAYKHNNQLSKYVSLEPDPYSFHKDIFPWIGLKYMAIFCPVFTYSQNSSKDGIRSGQLCQHITLMYNPVIVSKNAKYVMRFPCVITFQSRVYQSPAVRQSTSQDQDEATGMQIVRKIVCCQEVSKEIAVIIMTSWRGRTKQ